MTDTATALRESRRLASLARTALKDRKDARPHFAEALALRLKAAELDPTMVDPEWDEDLIGHAIQGFGRSRKRDKRLTDTELIAQQNADLVAYFKIQLGETAKPVQVSSQIENAVVVPDEWRKVRDGIELCKTCGHDYESHDDGLRCAVPCDCEGYVANPCRHRFDIRLPVRECRDCGEQQRLFPKMAIEDTEAFQQLQKENKVRA